MSWWSCSFTSGSPIEESYSLIKSLKPSAAPEIDMIGVFKLWAIPPISCPREAKRSFSISISWLSLIVCKYSFCCFWILLKEITKSPISSLETTGRLDSNFLLLEAMLLNPLETTTNSWDRDLPNKYKTKDIKANNKKKFTTKK